MTTGTVQQREREAGSRGMPARAERRRGQALREEEFVQDAAHPVDEEPEPEDAIHDGRDTGQVC